jgi:hypothetical protein
VLAGWQETAQQPIRIVRTYTITHKNSRRELQPGSAWLASHAAAEKVVWSRTDLFSNYTADAESELGSRNAVRLRDSNSV